MPNINISDERGRDAVVKVESVRARAKVRYIGPSGQPAYSRRLLKATINQSYDALVDQFKNDESLAQAMVKSDPEVDVEQVGQFLWGLSRVYVNPKDELVYRVTQTEIVRNVDGSKRKARPRRQLEANIDVDIPLTWTGTVIPKAEAVRRFVFGTKLQVVHVNGLTFDFLFDMATELAEKNVMMVMGAGSKGKSPLVFRRGSTPYRAFLEGRVQGDTYVLLLHLSNLEMKTVKDLTNESGNDGGEREASEKKAFEKAVPKKRLVKKQAVKKKVTNKKTAKKKVTKKKATNKKITKKHLTKKKETKKKTAKKKIAKKKITKKKITTKKVTKKNSAKKKMTKKKAAKKKVTRKNSAKKKATKKKATKKKASKKKKAQKKVAKKTVTKKKAIKKKGSSK